MKRAAKEKANQQGLAIVLAWPDTYCKQAGAWYDKALQRIGINQKGYYKAGHAALVLINSEGDCEYFDFGRYHAPYGHGRVRSSSTDPELHIHSRIKRGDTKEIMQLLYELAQNSACHGAGTLKAGVCKILYPKAKEMAISMQQQSPIAYGPLLPGGTNCSRFVRRVLLAGIPSFWRRFKLRFPYTFSPTPMFNVRTAGQDVFVVETPFTSYIPQGVPMHTVLPRSVYPKGLPAGCQWLSGEGGGSWYGLTCRENRFYVSRFSEGGEKEFEGVFIKANGDQYFDPALPFTFIYPSHYQDVYLQQGRQTLHLLTIESDFFLNVPGTRSERLQYSIID